MFLNPVMLAGIGGAAAPLVLHLLSRARYRSVDWGAMMFLAGAQARQRQSARLKQWVLLLLRMAMVALLAIALARPALRGKFARAAASGSGRATAVIIFDDSASMGYVENGRTRLDKAREVSLQILSAMNRGDEVSLILTGTAQTERERAPSSDLQSVAARVAGLQQGFGEADYAEALNQAADVLERYERSNREIYIVGDRQAVSWRNTSEAFHRNWQARWGSAGSPRVTVFQVGSEAADNVVVESMDVLNPPAVRGQPVELQVRVRNYGEIPRNEMPVTISAGQRILGAATMTLAPNSTGTIKTTVNFDQPGSHVIRAEVKSSGLTTDDALDYAMDVTAALRVLVISGDPVEESAAASRAATEPAATIRAAGALTEAATTAPTTAALPEPPTNAAELIRLALAPYATTGQVGADLAEVTLMSPRKWGATDLDAFNVVILANVERLSAIEARALEQYVYGGGGVLIAPGRLSRTDEYNYELYRYGAGILPAPLTTPVAADGSMATSLGSLDLNHPVFRFLQGRLNAVPSAPIARFFPVTPRSTDARVLGSYASGSPFLVEGGGGRGRVLLLTTSLDADWSTLPATNFYLPFVQSVVRYLGGGESANRNLLPGQPIITTIDGAADDKSVTIRLPGGRWEVLPVTRVEDRIDVRYTRTNEPGVYQLRYRIEGREARVHFVVTPPRAESNLATVSEARARTLAARVGFEHVDPTAATVTATIARDRVGRELWAVMVAGVLGLAGVEMLLARWWSGEGQR